MPRPTKERLCKFCGETEPMKFRGRNASRCRTCEVRELADNKRARFVADPILHKANSVMGGLRWGRGGGQRMKELIKKYLGTKCKYCKCELTLKNMSLDHKIPLAHSVRKASKKTRYSRDYDLTPEQIIELNSESNLHFVCLSCNRSKGNLTDEEYTSLLKYLSDKPRVKQIVLAKLKGSNFMYRK